MKPFDTVPELVPIEDLEQDIHNLCIGINAATCELLTLIREFDERVGWLKWGLENCAEWLAWRCDFSMTTAREKVRVAWALSDLPEISKQFSLGALSYTKVREMTRVATPGNEEQLVAFALKHTSALVAQRCREMRMGDIASLGTAERAFAERALRIHRNADRGTMTMSVDLPLEAGELIEKALDKARDDTCLEHPDIMDTTWSKRQADAFVSMVKAFLSGSGIDDGSSDNYLVNIPCRSVGAGGRHGQVVVTDRVGEAPVLRQLGRRDRRGE